MISKIGFKNFRRFKEYTEVDLGDINMFVGGNNAGKSTVVKALLLVANFLKTTRTFNRSLFDTPKFYFNNLHVNIDSFMRAKNWESTKEDGISFYLHLDYFDITIALNNSTDSDQAYAEIKSIVIYDSRSDIEYTFDFYAHKTHIVFGVSKESENTVTKSTDAKAALKDEIASLEAKISQGFDTESYGEDFADAFSRLTTLKSQYAMMEKECDEICKTNAPVIVDMELSQELGVSGRNYISSLILGIVDNIVAGNKKSLMVYKQMLKDSAIEFSRSVDNINIEYIYAHSAVQKVLFSTKDNNDYLSQSVKQLYDMKITSLSQVGKIMKGWLKEFIDIDSFKLAPISAIVKSTKDSVKEYTVGSGEGLAFAVKYHKQWHDLGDMGRGTIQLVALFINLAIILKKYEGSTIKPMVLVEEPEQNLHPAVQSKLADLFCELKDRLNIIIETHSEYLIRQTQLEVAQSVKYNGVSEEDINKMYKIYFFPTAGVPYSMGYQANGRFEEPFRDKGFFDEAGRIVRELTILERK